MNALPLSALHPTTRARLEALAVEWLGLDPWSFDPDLADGTWIHIRGALNFEPVLPLHLGAGFDLGVQLAADMLDSDMFSVARYVTGQTHAAPSSLSPTAMLRYDAIAPGADRLRAILLDLGRK